MENPPVLAQKFGIEPQQAQEIAKGLEPVRQTRDLLIEEFNQIRNLEITEENLPVFHQLRLKFRDNRTKGILPWHKAAKDIPLRMSQLIDAIKRNEVSINETYEEKLLDSEKHFERLEEERKAKLQAERLEIIRPYIEDPDHRYFGSMENDLWEAFLEAKKKAYQERIEAERKAEEERQRLETINQLRIERQKFVAPFYDFFDHGDDLGEMQAAEFTKRLDAARKAKAEFLAEQERIKKERQELEAKLEAERQEQARKDAERKKAEEAAAEKARKEREAAEAKAKAERERHERELQAERDRIAKIEAEAKAKKEAEEKAAKLEALAPEKEKMIIFLEKIHSLQSPDFTSPEFVHLLSQIKVLQNKIYKFGLAELEKIENFKQS